MSLKKLMSKKTDDTFTVGESLVVTAATIGAIVVPYVGAVIVINEWSNITKAAGTAKNYVCKKVGNVTNKIGGKFKKEEETEEIQNVEEEEI